MTTRYDSNDDSDTILIFGACGMLGRYMYRWLKQTNLYNIIGVSRDDFDITTFGNNPDKITDFLFNLGAKVDVIINCSAITDCSIDNYKDAIIVNTLFPLTLSNVCEKHDIKLIHISTNGIFKDNVKDVYVEDDSSNPDLLANHIYGVTKHLGEPLNASVIRTSIIGRKFIVTRKTHARKTPLIDWLIDESLREPTLNGFNNVYWNGVTCLQLAKFIEAVINSDLYWKGPFHVFNQGDKHGHKRGVYSKYELVQLIKQVYNLNVDIIEHSSDQLYNCILGSSKYKIKDGLIVPLCKQMAEQRDFDNHVKPGVIVGDFTTLTHCRFCNNSPLKDVLHLGDTFPLAGGFLSNLETDVSEERVYPLTLVCCERCCTVMCKQVVKSDVLFKKGYMYYSSMIPSLVTHFNNYATYLANKYLNREDSTSSLIVEMGCNDGVFLRPLKDKGFKVIGVDPSQTVKGLITDNFDIYNTYLTLDVVDDIVKVHGQADIFLSSNSFAHIDDMQTIFECIKKLLKQDGVAIIEVHYLFEILDNLNFDFIYHEHFTYYSVTSFYNISRLFGLSLVDVEFVSTHSRSIRVYIKNDINCPFVDSDKMKTLFMSEYNINIDQLNINEPNNAISPLKVFTKYTELLIDWTKEFRSFYEKLIVTSKRVWGYGASGRATTLCNFAKIDVPIVIDDAPSKIGTYTPYYHAKIVDKSALLGKERPDYVIILAWPYAKYIVQQNIDYIKNGGKFVVPLPNILMIDITNYINFVKS